MKQFTCKPKQTIKAAEDVKSTIELELDIVSNFDNGDYSGAEIYISHDNGRDRKKLADFNQFQELKQSLGEVLSDYIDDTGL